MIDALNQADRLIDSYKELDIDEIDIDDIKKLKSRLGKKLKISVLAEVSRGKSTFLNALIFKEPMLEFKNGETTANVFTIKYRKTFYKDLQKNNIKNINSASIEKISRLKDIETIIHTDNKQYKDYIFYDTPGFNTTNEEKMQEMIDFSLKNSDAVIFILDISKGITKEELSQVENITSKGIDNIIFVLNKMDTVRDELTSDELREHIEKIENDISTVTTLKYPVLSISSKEALVGFFKDNANKIESSNFKKFEQDFLNILTEVEEEKLLKIKSILHFYSFGRELIEVSVKESLQEIGYFYYKKIEPEVLINLKVKEHVEDLLVGISKNILEFPFNDYPETFFGNFDAEVFENRSEKIENEIGKFESVLNVLKKLDSDNFENYFNEIDSKLEETSVLYSGLAGDRILEELELELEFIDNVKDNFSNSETDEIKNILNACVKKASDLVMWKSTRLMLLKSNLNLLNFKVTSLEVHFSMLSSKLYVFYLQEKEAGWTDSASQISKKELSDMQNIFKVQLLENMSTLDDFFKDLLEFKKEFENLILNK